MRADRAASAQERSHLGCEVSVMFSVVFVPSGPARLLTGARVTCSSYSMCRREGQAVKVTFLLQERFFWELNPIMSCGPKEAQPVQYVLVLVPAESLLWTNSPAKRTPCFYTCEYATTANNEENNPDCIAHPLAGKSMDTVIHTCTVQMFPKCQSSLMTLKRLKI